MRYRLATCVLAIALVVVPAGTGRAQEVPGHRGSEYPRMQGLYFYGDYCTQRVWGLAFDGSNRHSSLLQFAPGSISSFGEDEAGNVYVADIQHGSVYKITDASPP
jgi:hypothetical protein